MRLPFAATVCTLCGGELDPKRPAAWNGVCHRFECQAVHASVVRLRREERRRARARQALVDAGLDPDAISWSITPRYAPRLVPVTPEEREAFRVHLGGVVADARSEEEAGTERPLTRAERRGSDPPALGEACAGCLGWCCRHGKTHAYLDPASLRRVWALEGVSPDETLALYEDHLAEEHSVGACVFHGPSGCTLPRRLRSDTCNVWHCTELEEVRRAWVVEGGPREPHTFVAVTRDTGVVAGLRTVHPVTGPPEDPALPEA